MEILKNRKIIGSVVILILAFFLYKFLAGSQVATGIVSIGPSATEANIDLLQMAADLAVVDYNSNLFKSPGYLLLTDFSAPLIPQPVGRKNPFDIIGRD
ncbi:MAG: hypothetical protein Q7R67_01960 [bacterium]|nr:hypothetical protein [bacterium]